ncbi:MAG TPA: hypothetical protein VMB52_01565 [Verrucomicrobiae bacterium]|nr:hypothetical protein [Verrucomicrobiae bacterium]
MTAEGTSTVAEASAISAGAVDEQVPQLPQDVETQEPADQLLAVATLLGGVAVDECGAIDEMPLSDTVKDQLKRLVAGWITSVVELTPLRRGEGVGADILVLPNNRGVHPDRVVQQNLAKVVLLIKGQKAAEKNATRATGTCIEYVPADLKSSTYVTHYPGSEQPAEAIPYSGEPAVLLYRNTANGDSEQLYLRPSGDGHVYAWRLSVAGNPLRFLEEGISVMPTSATLIPDIHLRDDRDKDMELVAIAVRTSEKVGKETATQTIPVSTANDPISSAEECLLATWTTVAKRYRMEAPKAAQRYGLPNPDDAKRSRRRAQRARSGKQT